MYYRLEWDIEREGTGARDDERKADDEEKEGRARRDGEEGRPRVGAPAVKDERFKRYDGAQNCGPLRIEAGEETNRDEEFRKYREPREPKAAEPQRKPGGANGFFGFKGSESEIEENERDGYPQNGRRKEGEIEKGRERIQHTYILT